MLRKSQMFFLFLFLMSDNSYQNESPKREPETPKPVSTKPNPRKQTEALDMDRLGTLNATTKPVAKKKAPITISSNWITGINGKIHKLYYVIPESGRAPHRKKTHEVKVRLRTRRHSEGEAMGKKWRHRKQRDLKVANRRWRAQRRKRELIGARDLEAVVADQRWRVQRLKKELADASIDVERLQDKVGGTPEGRVTRPNSKSKRKVLNDVDKRWYTETSVENSGEGSKPRQKRDLETMSDVETKQETEKTGRTIELPSDVDEISQSKWESDTEPSDDVDGRGNEYETLDLGSPVDVDTSSRQKRESGAEDDVDRWQEWRLKRGDSSGVPSDVEMRWYEQMRSRAPRDHHFVTKSKSKPLTNPEVVSTTQEPPVIKVYPMPEELNKFLRGGKSRDFTYARTPTKRIIYYATLPEIIRRPAAPEWYARHSGAFSQRGIGSAFTNSLLPFPSGPGQGTADIARIQSAIMDVRPPRDNLTPSSPQFTVVDLGRFPSLNEITSTNSIQNAGPPGSSIGQSLNDKSASSGVTEDPISINSILPSLNNNFISSLVTPLQMNGQYNGYQPAPYYTGPFPTRHHRFPLPADGYRPYMAPPSLGGVVNYKVDHPAAGVGGYYNTNSTLTNLLSAAKYPYYYEYTSSRVDPLKNHLLFSPTWGASRPPLYERITPSTHSTHSVVIDSQSININSTNVSNGNSTRLTPPVITNVTEHYESHE